MDNDLIQRSLMCAHSHHDGIFRKYEEPPQPYIEHPKRVAHRYSKLNLAEPFKSIWVSACFVHDVPEDPDRHGNFMSFETLVGKTSFAVARAAWQMRNPSKDFPELPRDDRKAMDRAHIHLVEDEGKLLKLIDRTDNLFQLVKAPAGFRRKYLGESELLLDAIGTVNYPDYIQLRVEYMEALEGVRRSLS